ncbi:hypothetical protein CEP53_009423 [Fusarium sp. AF-6]|nr:hypothetical protein CEP53_009423 [Fusarium sp. AF-6]
MSGQETSPQSPPANSGKHRRPWTSTEDSALRTLVAHFGDSRGPEGRWKDIATGLQGRTAKDCRKRWFHSLDPSLRKGRWTAQEDELLLSAYARLGPAWHDIAILIPGRKDDQCSKRYNDILNPSAKNRLSDWTAQEDNLLRQGVATLGHRWAAISSRIPGRPPLTCRNRWRTLSRQSHSRVAKSQGNTPSSSTSQMSPMDSGVSPAPQNLTLDMESGSGNAVEQIMPFSAMEAEAGGEQTGPSFLDSAFYETFSGPSPPSLNDADGENAEKVNGTGLQRGLAGRHLMMLAIGGVIGPGYFVGMGTGLSTAGPAGLLLCFVIVGVLLWAVMQSLGELGAFIPMSGSFTHYTSMFLDPALGFALGWNYWLLWAGIIIAEYNNLGLVLTYWETPIPQWGWIMIFWGIFLAFTFLSIQSFGEAEFWLALIKIIAILAFFLCAILITSGAIGGEKMGFKFYHDPGPFADGVKGVFKIFTFAALMYSGTEMIGLTAGESKNPAKDVPKAVKSVLWRIIGIFLLGIFFLTLTVPYNDTNLLSAKSKTARSPFVIAFTRVGATAGAHAINAVILITMFSAINSALYVGPRTLYGLAVEGLAPKIFAWTNSRGVPGLLSRSHEPDCGAGVVYTWIISMTGVATFITWGLISLNHIRFRMALRAQNIPIDVLSFRAPAWRFCAYLGVGGNLFFAFFQGWTSFAPWDVEAFFMNYVIILVFIILAVGWKFTHKTKFVTLKSIDFSSARLWNVEMQMRADAEAAVQAKEEEIKE